jgi:DNA-binding CsgD family transcriptional regulator
MKYLKRISIVILFEEHYLVNKIKDDMNDEVIRLYLQGLSRYDIAITCGLSQGTVSNIIDEWKRRLGIPDVQSLRNLAVNLKRCGIDAVQCAQGFRILMIMKKSGVNENQFESFIHEVYEYCQRFDLTPEHIASNLKELVKLSKDIPFAKIPEYIEKKKNEITKLEEDIQTLKEKKEGSEVETSVANDLRDAALENEKTTVAELGEYSNFKTELRKCGLSIEEDIPKFVQVVYGIKQYEYDVNKVLSDYSDEQIKQIKRDLLINQVKRLEDTKLGLLSECSSLESQETCIVKDFMFMMNLNRWDLDLES